MKKLVCFAAVFLLLCGRMIPMVHAGNLAPPADAFDGVNPASTMKTINDVEPRRPVTNFPVIITEAGSYYLVSNMVTSANIVGIEIHCSDVHIDLNGFALIGTNTTQDAIKVVGTNQNISIENGAIRQWGGFGINAPGANDGAVKNIRANRNGLGGIVYGDGGLIEECLTFGNGYSAPIPPSFVPPAMNDQDFDGMDDDAEQAIVDANPADWITNIVNVCAYDDFDMDGIPNIDEINGGTDPTVNESPDSDNDGMDDQWEIDMIVNKSGGSITGIYEVTPSSSWGGIYDFDSDGFANQDEFWSNTDPADPNSYDWDYDGMEDSWESNIWSADLGNPPWDIWGVQPQDDYDGDLASNWDEYKAGTDPTSAASKPAMSGYQTEYTNYTAPPDGPIYDKFDDPTDEPSDDGIRVGGFATIKSCKSRGNRGSGILAHYGSRILDCISAGNYVDGIHVTDYCSVLDCTAAKNLKGGITCGAKNRIKDNNCGQNGDYKMQNIGDPEGAGITIFGNGNRIEDNNVCGNAIGIFVDSAYSQQGTGMSGGRNLIIRNSAADNWGMAFQVSGGDYMGGTMDNTDYGDAATTNTAAIMDAGNPFTNFNF